MLSELEPELEPHYNTAAAYFPSAIPASKDFVVTTSTDKGIVKVLDRNKKTSAATYRDAAGSGDAIYVRRPGLIPSKFFTTHFLTLISSLINLLEGFCSGVTT